MYYCFCCFDQTRTTWLFSWMRYVYHRYSIWLYISQFINAFCDDTSKTGWYQWIHAYLRVYNADVAYWIPHAISGRWFFCIIDPTTMYLPVMIRTVFHMYANYGIQTITDTRTSHITKISWNVKHSREEEAEVITYVPQVHEKSKFIETMWYTKDIRRISKNTCLTAHEGHHQTQPQFTGKRKTCEFGGAAFPNCTTGYRNI